MNTLFPVIIKIIHTHNTHTDIYIIFNIQIHHKRGQIAPVS